MLLANRTCAATNYEGRVMLASREGMSPLLFGMLGGDWLRAKFVVSDVRTDVIQTLKSAFDRKLQQQPQFMMHGSWGASRSIWWERKPKQMQHAAAWQPLDPHQHDQSLTLQTAGL